MKLVGADSGHYEHEEFVERGATHSVRTRRGRRPVRGPGATDARAPNARADVRTREDRRVATIRPFRRSASSSRSYAQTRRGCRAPANRAVPGRSVRQDLGFIAEMDMGTSEERRRLRVPYASRRSERPTWAMPQVRNEAARQDGPHDDAIRCPMHPEITSAASDRCPKCGMKLVPADLVSASDHAGLRSSRNEHGEHGGHHEHGPRHRPNPDERGKAHHHGHHQRTSGEHDHGRHEGEPSHQAGHGAQEHGHMHDASQRIEWEDDMVEVNRLTTPSNMRWKLVDRDTGAENARGSTGVSASATGSRSGS